MKNNLLALLAGNDIPIEQIQLVVHQPKIKQIAYLGEEDFYTGCQFLTFSKDKILKSQDKTHLESLSDFKILMTIIKDNSAIKKKECMELVLMLLFPDYKINFLPESIMLFKKDNETGEVQQHLIDENNFQILSSYIKNIFCLQELLGSGTDKYNPGGPHAKALVQKFKLRQRKLAQIKKNGQKNQSISILSRYISILAVGQQKDMNQLLQYTVYQLFDQFRRYKMKDDFDRYISFKIAGAKNMGQIENWMDDIHSNIL